MFSGSTSKLLSGLIKSNGLRNISTGKQRVLRKTWTTPELPEEAFQSVPNKSELSWQVLRNTNNKLPVFSDYKLNKIVTLIRHVRGNQRDLMKFLKDFTQQEPVERAGTIEVKGKWVQPLKKWLEKAGF